MAGLNVVQFSGFEWIIESKKLFALGLTLIMMATQNERSKPIGTKL